MFVELQELVMDQDQEVQWREMAQWMHSEEQGQEENWTRTRFTSLSFCSLLELRETICHGKKEERRRRRERERRRKWC